MPNRLKTINPSDKVVKLPTGYEPDSYLEAVRRRKYEARRRQHRVRRAGAAVLVAAIGYVGFNVVKDMFKSPVGVKNNAEKHLIENKQRNGEALTIDNSLYVFHAGVKYRSSPDIVGPDDGSSESNISGRVKGGQELVGKEVISLEKDGSTWLGFEIIKDLSDPHQKGPGSAGALAKHLVWVDFSEIDGQVDSNGANYYERHSFDPANNAGLTAHIAKDGQISLADGQPAAIAQIMTVEQAGQFVQLSLSSHGA